MPALLMALMLLLCAAQAAHGQEGAPPAPPAPVVRITEINVEDFPEVRVTAYAVNLGPALIDSKVLLWEDGVEQTELEPLGPDGGGGVAIGLLIDGTGSMLKDSSTGNTRYAEIAYAVRRFVAMNLLRAETDMLAAYTVDATGSGFRPLAEWNWDHGSVANSVPEEAPWPLPGSSALYGLIEYGLQQIEMQPAAMRRSLVLFSDGFTGQEQIGIEEIAEHAHRRDVTIHTVLVGGDDGAGRLNLEQIAERTGGKFVTYSTVAEIEPFWRRLADERPQQYRYQLDSAQPAQIKLELIAFNQSASDTEAFPAVPAQPPSLAVAQPQPNTRLERTGTAADSQLVEMKPGTLDVSLDVQWPDNHPRALKSVEYAINGKPLLVNQESSGPFTLTLPIGELGDGLHTLLVSAVDVLGLPSPPVTVSFEVKVTALAAAPTPPPGEEGAAPVAPAEADAGFTAWLEWRLPFGDASIVYGTTADGQRQFRLGEHVIALSPANFILATLLPVLLIAALVLGGRRRRPAAAQALPLGRETTVGNQSTVIEAGGYEVHDDETDPAVLPDFEPPAALHYMAGGEHLDKQFKVAGGHEVRIGRERHLCDIVIDDQRVSRLHASIKEGDDGNFYIMDQGSSGGTYVNRHQLRANDMRRLNHGDTINFNAVAYRFELTDQAGQ